MCWHSLLIVLTDSDFKSTTAYAFLKELQKEIYREVPSFETQYESINSLAQCRDAVLLIMNSYGDQKKVDKLSQA